MVIGCVLLLPTVGQAATAVGSVVTVSGDAQMERNGAMRAIAIHDDVFQSDVIITGDKGRVKLLMADSSKVYVGSKTRIGLQQYAMDDKGLFKASLDLAWGKARFFVNKLVSRKSSFEVKTSTAVLGVRGTGWLTEVVNGQTFVTQFEGVLSVQTAQGTFSVRDGQVASISAAGAFHVRPATRQEMSLKQIDPDVGDKVVAGDEAQAQGRSPDGKKPEDKNGGEQQGEQPQGDHPQGNHPQGDQPQGDQPQGDHPQGNQPQGAGSPGTPPPPPAVVPERPTHVIVPDGFAPVAGAASSGGNQTGATGAQGQQQGGAPTGTNPAPQAPPVPQAPPTTVLQNALQPPTPPTTVIQNAVQQTQTTVNITPQFVLP